MTHPKILSIGTSNPNEKFSQEETYHLLGYRSAKIKSIFMNSEIDYRYFYVDSKKVKHPESLDQLYTRYLQGSLDLGQHAVQDAISGTPFSLQDIDFVATVSCTGYLCPALSTRLVHTLGMKNNVQQANILGMGCSGAMPGLQRVFDHLSTYPEHIGLLVCVEVCSATYFIDKSLETVVGNAICGDGAAALVLGNNSEIAGPRILDFETLIAPEHIDKVGFDYDSGRLKIILKKEIPDLASPYVNRAIEQILKRNRLKREDIKYWIVHSGGRKVLDQFKENLHLTEQHIRHSRFILRNYGNMSSPTVIFVLKEIWEKEKPSKGERGIMIALGPGLSVEGCLLQW